MKTISIRTDKFKVGDVVDWSARFSNWHLVSSIGSLPPPPYTVSEVEDAPEPSWPAVGHTQHVRVEGIDGRFSGAFFKKKKEEVAMDDDSGMTLGDILDKAMAEQEEKNKSKPTQTNRLDRIEAKLDQLLANQMPPAPQPTVNINDIKFMLNGIANDQKIEAIKGLRAISGLGLKEAKEMIEAYFDKPKF